MDDDKFKKELLHRLDKIIALLSLSCAIDNGSLDKSKAESALRQITSQRSEDSPAGKPTSIHEEMDEIYSIELQKYRERMKGQPS
ncbi:MAG TPA: hypothetical protein VJ550_00845 [Geomonas sp.]|nr:hypothetical protein [Geomonas sp.]